jgi:uncharacterized protein (TIGR02284 family)
MMHHGRSNI